MLSLGSLSLFACAGSGQQKYQEEAQLPGGPPFPYNLENHLDKVKLADELEEISGITYVSEGQLAGVQDEKGNIYWIATNSGDIQRGEDFGKDGDYEDIALVGEDFYALRSDGGLYHVKPPYTSSDKIETPLGASNDTEGLCYLPDSHKLLIACKAQSGIDGHIDGKRAIYAFDIAQQKLSSQPYMLIDLDKLGALAGRPVPFEPSGIAQHPISKDLYVISSVGKLLIVLNIKGEVIHLQSLDIKGFKQPEGICFSPKGTLYISNEGRGGSANIMSYAYQP